MVVDAVTNEPVSGAGFPVNREINRVFLLFFDVLGYVRRNFSQLFNRMRTISLVRRTGNCFSWNRVIPGINRETNPCQCLGQKLVSRAVRSIVTSYIDLQPLPKSLAKGPKADIGHHIQVLHLQPAFRTFAASAKLQRTLAQLPRLACCEFAYAAHLSRDPTNSRSWLGNLH